MSKLTTADPFGSKGQLDGEIDADEALQMLHDALETLGPDFVYPSQNGCYYNFTKDAGTRCLIGTAFALHGHQISDEIEHFVLNDVVGTTKIQYYTGWPMTDGARSVFRAAQEQQDKGMTWGESVEFAEHLHGRLIRTERDED